MYPEEHLTTFESLNEKLASEMAVLLYFSTTSCNVGEALEPKIRNLLENDFPKIKFYKINLNFNPEIAAHYNAFVEPTILVFFDGKETVRRSRNIGVYELEEAIKRQYQLIFE